MSTLSQQGKPGPEGGTHVGLSRAARAQRTEADPRWRLVCERRAEPPEAFVYAVRSTGIYCRPGCASRRPRPENVSFYDGPPQAEAAGFRACQRCTPDEHSPEQVRAALIARLCRFIERSEQPPSLSELSDEAGLSPYHLHRVFKATLGITPHAYAKAHRQGRLREALQTSDSVTAAAYAAGYSSSGRFYAESDEALGMKPGAYKRQGAQLQIEYAVATCALGQVLVAATERGVCAILVGDEADELAEELRATFAQAKVCEGGLDLASRVEAVVAALDDPRTACDLPLDIRGTAFQRRVWQALREIPVGETRSYSEIAAGIGAPTATRAVARACAANRLAVVIPCHRVLRSDGSISGYRWGVERKRRLLAQETEILGKTKRMVARRTAKRR